MQEAPDLSFDLFPWNERFVTGIPLTDRQHQGLVALLNRIVRRYSCARYVDDCNVYVGSRRAGEPIMAYLRKLYTGLKLQINEAKSAVGSAFGRKFLGYALWVAKGKEVKCAVANKALDNFKARIRQLTRRSGGRSMAQVVDKLRPYLLGWKAYFGLAQTPRVWRGLDEWLRHRLRAIQLKHWKRPKTIYWELKALGAKENVALQRWGAGPHLPLPKNVQTEKSRATGPEQALRQTQPGGL
jgi:hypothetical protein